MDTVVANTAFQSSAYAMIKPVTEAVESVKSVAEATKLGKRINTVASGTNFPPLPKTRPHSNKWSLVLK